jgi:hypothetical protein
MDEQTLRVLSAERTKLKATWYTLGGISVVIDGMRALPAPTEEHQCFHLDAAGQSLAGAKVALKEAILKIEAVITWLEPDDSSGA